MREESFLVLVLLVEIERVGLALAFAPRVLQRARFGAQRARLVVLDALDNGPHAENTIVVLFSDHGYHLGEKQRWSKFSLWERTTHVPLIVSVPDGLKGRTDKPVELLSIYPTIIDLCGLPVNPKLEGVSLKPLLKN